ncbi:hypothetical protein [Notoacmeibacter marinus]|uniref:hypothetical protein n=1 Tax=Notoacmeibacter marinus TaxID=1876515 RepID=UPI001F0A761B|nr:hypothetical protein [Notoacmeibacter marinus]
MSREYVVRIEFERGNIPRVMIKEPDIELLAQGRELPHIYHDPTRLCLYLPKSQEWAGWMRIDQTFVPWTAIWLYYFEEWLVSGEWKGGGEHPSADDDEKPNRHVRRASNRCW